MPSLCNPRERARADPMASPANLSEQVSLAFQCMASVSWAVGAALAGPKNAADYLQFAAALAWCAANLFAAQSMRSKTPVQAPRCAMGDEAGVEMN